MVSAMMSIAFSGCIVPICKVHIEPPAPRAVGVTNTCAQILTSILENADYEINRKTITNEMGWLETGLKYMPSGQSLVVELATCSSRKEAAQEFMTQMIRYNGGGQESGIDIGEQSIRFANSFYVQKNDTVFSVHAPWGEPVSPEHITNLLFHVEACIR